MYYPQQYPMNVGSPHTFVPTPHFENPHISAPQPYVPHMVNPTQVEEGAIKERRHNPYGANVVGMTQYSSEVPSEEFPAFQHHSSMEYGAEASMVSAPSGSFNGSFSTRSNKASYPTAVSTEELMAQQGHLAELARTANGSSFIQAALRDTSDEMPANLSIIWAELEPCFGDLLLDAHGCYVTKTVMERLPAAQLQQAVDYIANDEQLMFSLCTHSLHTRRVVQFLMDSVDVSFLIHMLIQRCTEVSTTQQGCIIMQRAMDVVAEPLRTPLFDAIYKNLIVFAVDPFANYVVQHMLEVGDRQQNSRAIKNMFNGRVLELSCNKFSSNVMEKVLYHVDPTVQHELVMEMYNIDDEGLLSMLQDSFGNYLIQSSIALAQYKDVFFISEKLRPVLERTPYGYKIAARLERRLKGKPVGTRSPGQSQGRGRGGRGSNKGSQNGSNLNNSLDGQTEEPW